ncbi:class I SAM-dependent RNA methyltransferase [bacterium]|nr:class I SAM-dependent RNA methyltransferase [bacterium]
MKAAGFLYQVSATYFAQTDSGVEELAMREAEALGADQVEQGFRGFSFKGSAEVLYRLNYQARLITRILAPLKEFRCRDTDAIYHAGKEIDWPRLFPVEKTFAVFGTVSNSVVTHSKFASLRLKDAIADTFRDHLRGRRPGVDTVSPDMRIALYINNNQGTIYLDTSGDSLHMRGYREQSVPAPMRETVAAAVIRMSGWQGERPLYDPMCGSGTLLAEALMHHCLIPAAYLRKRFGFEQLPDFDPAVWKRVQSAADEKIREIEPGLIGGSDIDPRAFEASSVNLQKLPGGEDLLLRRRDFRSLDGLENRTIITNPPYGIRLKDKEQAGTLLKEFGDFLKQKCAGSTAYVYFGDREQIKRVGLKTAFKQPLRSGGLDGRLCRFDMY